MLFLYLGFLATGLPATLLTSRLETLFPEMGFDRVSGSFWKGLAQQAVYQQLDLGQFVWLLSPSELVGAEWANYASFSGGVDISAEGLVALSPFGKKRLENTSINGQLGPLLAATDFQQMAIMPEARFQIQIDTLEWQDDAQLNALHADFQLLELKLAGLYLGDISGKARLSDNQYILVDLFSQNDDGLGVDGSLVITTSGDLELTMALTRIEVLGKETAKLLQFFTKRDNDRYLFNWRGNFNTFL